MDPWADFDIGRGITCRMFMSNKYVIIYDKNQLGVDISSMIPSQQSMIISNNMIIYLSEDKEVTGIDISKNEYLKQWEKIIRETNKFRYEDVIGLDKMSKELFEHYKSFTAFQI